MVIDLGRKIRQKMERCGRRGLKYDQEKKAMGRDRRKWRRILLETKVHNKLWRLRRRKREK